jgi:hypothetical protein
MRAVPGESESGMRVTMNSRMFHLFMGAMTLLRALMGRLVFW